MKGSLKNWNARKNILWFLFYFSLAKINFGQVHDLFNDSISLANPNYAMDRYHETLRYNEPVMYLAIPVIKPILERSVALRNGEGKDGYWAEGNFGHRFVVYQGKYYTHPFFQRMRLTFDVGIVLRLTQDESNPLLPGNNKFGVGFDFLLSSLKKLRETKGGLLWTTVQLHHYSNGQADSFFLDVPVKRNNYKNGDFSTNYLRFMLNVSGHTKKDNNVTAGIGYQQEVDLGGPFSSSHELENYYGEERILFHFQWIKKPKLLTINKVNRAANNTDPVKKEIRRHFGIRTELEYINGDLSLFPGNNKYRLSWHNYFTYMPSVSNEIGFMLHTFLGRDYLNIRFDDIVVVGEMGLYFRFNPR